MTDNSDLRAKLDEMVKAKEADPSFEVQDCEMKCVETIEAVALDLLSEKEELKAKLVATQTERDEACRYVIASDVNFQILKDLVENTKSERDAAKARAEKAEALVVMLREALENAMGWLKEARDNIISSRKYRRADAGVRYIREALSCTAPAAQEWEARIRKEEQEAAMQRVIRLGALSAQTPEGVLAAIMGSGGFDGPDGQSHKGFDGPTGQSHRGE